MNDLTCLIWFILICSLALGLPLEQDDSHSIEESAFFQSTSIPETTLIPSIAFEENVPQISNELSKLVLNNEIRMNLAKSVSSVEQISNEALPLFRSTISDINAIHAFSFSTNRSENSSSLLQPTALSPLLLPKSNSSDQTTLKNDILEFQGLALYLNSSPSSSQQSEEFSCLSVSQCEPLQEQLCLGSTLPYTHTSVLSTGLRSQKAARDELESWAKSLQQLPRCWSVVQPYLCLVFFPPCDENTKVLYLPPQDLCEAVHGPCSLVSEGRGWPDYMNCSVTAARTASSLCTAAAGGSSSGSTASLPTSLRDVKFNSSSGVCVSPLVPTPRSEAWYRGVRGCGLPCADPTFSKEETAGFQSFLALMTSLGVACCAFTVMTYLLEWRCGGARRYPSALLLYLCLCSLVAGVAVLTQFHGNVRQVVACHSDGTLRHHEPSTQGNMSCVVVFACLYYFGVAAVMWLLILSYSWCNFFTTLEVGETESTGAERGSAYYHLLAWSLPLVLTITVLAMGQVSADYLHGVCFLAPAASLRAPLLLAPLTFAALLSVFFLAKGLVRLCQLKAKCGGILSPRTSSCLLESIARLSVLILTLVGSVVLTIYCHASYYAEQQSTEAAFRRFILCGVGLVDSTDECQVAVRPSLTVYKLQVIAWAAPTIVFASFAWTSSAANVWRTFFRRLIGVEEQQRWCTAGKCGGVHDLCLVPPLPPAISAGTDGKVEVGGGRRNLLRQTESRAFEEAAAAAANSDSEHSISTRYSIGSGLQYFASRRQQRKGRMRRHSLDSQLSFHVSDVEREAARHTMIRFSAAETSTGHHRASIQSYSSRTSRLSGGLGRSGWLSHQQHSGRTEDSRRGSFTSEDSSFSAISSVVVTGVGMGTEDTLFSNMMRRLNLSSSAASSAPPLTQEHIEETVLFGNPSSGSYPSVRQATIGVQTSLDSTVHPSEPYPHHVESADKCVQVCLLSVPSVVQVDSSSENYLAIVPKLSNCVPDREEFADMNVEDRIVYDNNLHNSNVYQEKCKVGVIGEGKSCFSHLQTPLDNKILHLSSSGSSLYRVKTKPSKSKAALKPAARRRKRKQIHNTAVSHQTPTTVLAVTETSFLGADPERSNSTDQLLTTPGEAVMATQNYRKRTRDTRPSSSRESGYPSGHCGRLVGSAGGASSALTCSRGSCLQAAETVSTILDIDDLSYTDF